MRKEEVIINCDLDVHNAIKTLPKDEVNCAIYLRGEVEKDGEGIDCQTHTVVAGTPESLCGAILNVISNDETMRALIFDGVLNYFGENPEEAEAFAEHLKTAVSDD